MAEEKKIPDEEQLASQGPSVPAAEPEEPAPKKASRKKAAETAAAKLLLRIFTERT